MFLLPGAPAAHSFTQPYTLPVPFAVYAFGTTAALLLSFLVVGMFATVPLASGALWETRVEAAPTAAKTVGPTIGLSIGRALSVFFLFLCIATGWFGTQNSFANFSMTFFWIVFVLGVAYTVSVVGDFYAPINPWKTLVDWLERLLPGRFAGTGRYPAWLAYYPALGLYIAFICFELFAKAPPRGLAIALILYTLINVLGAARYGKAAWFRHGEFFGVFLRLLGRMSPWARPWDPEERVCADARRWRLPFLGLLETRAEHPSLLLFILFMLSSTAYDALYASQPWTDLFWKDLFPLIDPLLPTERVRHIETSRAIYYSWLWFWLVVSPFVYLAVYAAFVVALRAITRAAPSVRDLMSCFAMSLVPIAFVYHVTHYYTLLLAQAGQMLRLVSDPFGVGWNLFGTAQLRVDQFLIDIGIIWHTQVALILIGHIAAVYLAHVEALRLFSSARRAAVSQLPLLLLMVIFTTVGLWILSLPLASH